MTNYCALCARVWGLVLFKRKRFWRENISHRMVVANNSNTDGVCIENVAIVQSC